MTTPTVDPAALDNVGWRLVLAERDRQVLVEGWTGQRDDHYTRRELHAAARCYRDAVDEHTTCPPTWPFDQSWWKPRHRVDNLTRAGALLLAEAERLQRAGYPASAHHVHAEARAVAEGLANLIAAHLRATVPPAPGGNAS